MDKSKARGIIQWPRLQLGRYIRAVTGHNNLLYHLHNMDAHISPICRFCLEANEEFHHLATECPPLWWERHNITAQETGPTDKWSPQQIIDFTYIPRINDAFIRPLYKLTDSRDEHGMQETASQQLDSPDIDINSEAESNMDSSVMDVSSLEDSSDYDDGMSIISICSE